MMSEDNMEPVALFRMTVLAIQDPDGHEALLVALGVPEDPPPPWVRADECCRMLQAGLEDGTIQSNLEDAWRTLRAQAN
jgi:hypothetical protein